MDLSTQMVLSVAIHSKDTKFSTCMYTATVQEYPLVLQSEIEDCDRSEEYPIGLTECNFQIRSVRRQRIAQIDCGKQ